MPDYPDTKLERIADDVLIGARAIAEEIGEDENCIYYLHKTQRLPIGKLGKNLIATRTGLRRALRALIPSS